MNKLIIYFDGHCAPNPGIMGIGVFVDGDPSLCVSRCAGYGTNNKAEWLALIDALMIVGKLMRERANVDAFEIRGDSQLVINQFTGKWRTRDRLMAALRSDAKAAERGALEAARQRGIVTVADPPAISVCWIPREQNGAADALSKGATNV